MSQGTLFPAPDDRRAGRAPRVERALARSSDPGTSLAAAVSLDTKTLTRLERIVLDAVRAAGDGGMTTHELADTTRLDRVTVSPRIKPLVDRGLIEDSGSRRPGPSGRSSIAWRVTKENL